MKNKDNKKDGRCGSQSNFGTKRKFFKNLQSLIHFQRYLYAYTYAVKIAILMGLPSKCDKWHDD